MPVWNRGAHDAGDLLDDAYRPGAIAERRSRLREPHVSPLTDLAERIASTEDEAVPYFDPASAGIHAAVLLLLQDPSRVAHGSGFISRHNNDQTAANTWSAADTAGLGHDTSLHWNVVPWWVADPAKIEKASGRRRSIPSQVRRAAPYLARTIELLPRLHTVVLVGRKAQEAWDRAALSSQLRVLRCPHTSPLAWNMTDRRSGRPNRELTIETLLQAAQDP